MSITKVSQILVFVLRYLLRREKYQNCVNCFGIKNISLQIYTSSTIGRLVSNGISIISNEHISMKIYTSPIIGRLVSHHISWIDITYPEVTQVHIGWMAC